MFHVKHYSFYISYVSRETYIKRLQKIRIFDNIRKCNKHIVIWSDLEKSSHVNLCLCALFLWRNMKKINKTLWKEANKAYRKNEIPVGCVITQNGRIIARAHNNKQSMHDVTGHAEIIAIKKASQKVKDWRLENCELYVTLEPCNMCKEVIRQSRIKKVNYILASKFNNEDNKQIKYIQCDNCDLKNNINELMKSFFSSKR